MTQQELFEKTQEFLKAEDIGFELDSEGCALMVRLDGKNADVGCQLSCVEDPLLIHALAMVPIRVPQEANNRVMVGLNEMNGRCKLGGFQLDLEDRRIIFRLSLPFEGVIDATEVIRVAMGVSMHAMDQAVHELMKLTFGSSEEEGLEECVLPGRGISPLQAPDGQRPGFN